MDMTDALASALLLIFGAIAFSIAFICETLVLWGTGWGPFRPAVAISFIMNLATFYIGTHIFAYWVFVLDHHASDAGVFMVFGLAFTVFDGLTMLFIARLLKWPHTPSNIVGIAIGANVVSMMVTLLFLSIVG